MQVSLPCKETGRQHNAAYPVSGVNRGDLNLIEEDGAEPCPPGHDAGIHRSSTTGSGCHWQFNPECAPLSKCAADTYSTSLRFHDLLHERKADARALIGFR